MKSIIQQINLSPHVDMWRRFHTTAERRERILEIARHFGMTVRSAKSADATDGSWVVLSYGKNLLCVVEPSHLSPAPFHNQPADYTVAYTENPTAIAEIAGAVGQYIPIAPPSTPTHHAICHFSFQSEEQMAWMELENRIIRAIQFLGQIELEGDAFLRALGHTVRTLLTSDQLELQLESPAEYWPERGGSMSWLEAEKAEHHATSTLTPRLQRLLYRRDNVLFIEDLSTAPDVVFLSAPDQPLYTSCMLLPFISGAKPSGILKLFYYQKLFPLPGDMEALELFRRELAVILDRARVSLQMQRLATVDGLTNLFNHRFFINELHTEYQRAVRYQKLIAVVMIDIDDFKSYNDTYGHLAGDRVLAQTARTIRGTVRDIDFVARYGGEEFALILPEIDARAGLIVAEKIRGAVEAQRLLSDEGEPIGGITVSCGVTDNRDTTSPEELIDRADHALYWVKRHGRNMVHLATEEDND
jgi:diguanylate cyclase (GGDEF)-like protein